MTQENPITVFDNLSVVIAEDTSLQEFFLDGANLDALYGKIETIARGLVADVSTKEGIAQIKTAARQIASIKKKVDDAGKDVVAVLKDLPKKIDANRAAFRKKMEELQDDIRRPVTDIEEREEQIADIKKMHLEMTGLNSAELKVRLKLIQDALADCKPDVWKESFDAVKVAYQGEINAIGTLITIAERNEEQQRELEELRKKQAEADRIIRENQIKEEAEKKAREDAALREQQLRREKEEAERRAHEAEERAKQAAATIAPAANEKAAQPKPAAPAPGSKWTPEQKAINNQVLNHFKAIIAEYLQGHTDQGYELVAKKLVGAIIAGKIENVKVVY